MPLAWSSDKTLCEVDLFTSLLGILESICLIFDTSRSGSSFRIDGAGLLSFKDDMVDRRLSHDDLGLLSSLSVEVSLAVVVLDLKIPLLLNELPLDSVKVLSALDERSRSRNVFRRNKDDVMDCCTGWLDIRG